MDCWKACWSWAVSARSVFVSARTPAIRPIIRAAGAIPTPRMEPMRPNSCGSVMARFCQGASVRTL